MSLFKSFVPFIAFAVVSNWLDWRLGLAAGLVATIVMVLRSPSRRLGALGLAQVVFFVVMGAIAIAQPDSPIKDQVNTIAWAWFAVVATGSILLGRPFTRDYSDADTAPEIRATELYRDITRTIAWAWVGCFAGCAVGGVVASVADNQSISTVVTIALLVVAIKFTSSYPDRAVAAASAATPAELSTTR